MLQPWVQWHRIRDLHSAALLHDSVETVNGPPHSLSFNANMQMYYANATQEMLNLFPFNLMFNCQKKFTSKYDLKLNDVSVNCTKQCQINVDPHTYAP